MPELPDPDGVIAAQATPSMVWYMAFIYLQFLNRHDSGYFRRWLSYVRGCVGDWPAI